MACPVKMIQTLKMERHSFMNNQKEKIPIVLPSLLQKNKYFSNQLLTLLDTKMNTAQSTIQVQIKSRQINTYRKEHSFLSYHKSYRHIYFLLINSISNVEVQIIYLNHIKRFFCIKVRMIKLKTLFLIKVLIALEVFDSCENCSMKNISSII